MTSHQDPESAALIAFLDAQRGSVLAIVAGLDDDALRAPLLPSGWTPLGLIQHLAFAERHWFQRVASGSVPPTWAGDGDEGSDGPFRTNQSTANVIAFYREQCAIGNALLAAEPLSSAPRGRHPGDDDNEVTDLRWIALHMIEETARHAGHLDAARELLDGQTGLGPR